jgi:disulfide bond formation protein DsbB
MRRVPSILLMTALLLAWPLVASAGVQAPGAAAPTAAAGLRADFNGDGAADLAIGAPGEGLGAGQAAAGVVQVLYGSAGGLTAAGSQLWSQDSPGIAGTAEARDGFGSALAAGDFNADGRADLAVGVPSENATTGLVFGTGVVHVLYGSAGGLTAAGSQLWSQDSPGVGGVAEAGDGFGSALAAGDFNADDHEDLAVGAFGENLDRGVVHVVAGSPAGLTGTGSQLWSQGSGGVAGIAEAGDSFGFALATGTINAGSHADLAIAAPSEDVGSVVDAGAVNVLYGSAGGLTAADDQQWFQDSPGVAGVSETQDFLGSALATGDYNGDGLGDLAAGAAGETLAVVAEAAGAVNVLYGSAGGLTAAGNQVWSQDSPGVAGLTEPRDLFGSALTTGDFNADGRAELAVGVPGETLGDVPNPLPEAGVVHVLPGAPGGLTGVGSQLWTQDSPGIADQAEDSDRLGSALATGDFNADGPTDLAVGAPGENLNVGFGSGVVHALPGSGAGLTATGSQLWSQDSPGVAGAPEFLDFFGQTLAASIPDGAGGATSAGAATGSEPTRPTSQQRR